jgi:plasmid stabilization system protein ParE
MRYTVVWLPSVEKRLIQIWLAASDRQAVRYAADEMDRLLKHWPTMVGVPYRGRRQLVVEPCGAGRVSDGTWTVAHASGSAEDRLVRVVQMTTME